MSWDELQPELVSMIEADKAGGVFMKAILYMIITFGIFGTILMMISERKRELGVMIAIGMQRHKLGIILFFETLIYGIAWCHQRIAGQHSIGVLFLQKSNSINRRCGENND